jgi:hypothetical protein
MMCLLQLPYEKTIGPVPFSVRRAISRTATNGITPNFASSRVHAPSIHTHTTFLTSSYLDVRAAHRVGLFVQVTAYVLVCDTEYRLPHEIQRDVGGST